MHVNRSCSSAIHRLDEQGTVAEQAVQTPQRPMTALMMRNGKMKMRVMKMVQKQTSSRLQTLRSRQLRHQS